MCIKITLFIAVFCLGGPLVLLGGLIFLYVQIYNQLNTRTDDPKKQLVMKINIVVVLHHILVAIHFHFRYCIVILCGIIIFSFIKTGSFLHESYKYLIPIDENKTIINPLL